MAIRVEIEKLVGESVVLEPIRISHVDGLFDIGQVREDWAYLPISGFSCRADTQKWVEQALALAESGSHYTFVLVQPSSGQVMGSTRYLNIRERECCHPPQTCSIRVGKKMVFLSHTGQVENSIIT